MNYKISTYVLLIILIALVSRLIYEDGVGQLSQNEQDQFKADVKELNRDAGDLITPLKAKEALDRFATKKKRDIFYTWKKHSYGYFFGLNKIDEFRKVITKLDSIQPDNNKIIGVRVYKSMTLKENNKKHYDVFMVPVTADGHNLPEIDTHQDIDSLNFTDEGTVLNASIPCPNQCSQN